MNHITLALLLAAGVDPTAMASKRKPDPDLERRLLASVPPTIPEVGVELLMVRDDTKKALAEVTDYLCREGITHEVRDLLEQRARDFRESLDRIEQVLRDVERATRERRDQVRAERPQAAPPPAPAPPPPPEPSGALAVACPACKAAPGEGCRPGRSLTTTHKERLVKWRKESR